VHNDRLFIEWVSHGYDDEREHAEFFMSCFMNLSVIHEMCSVEGMMIGKWQKIERGVYGSSSGLIEVLWKMFSMLSRTATFY
jgi:hypothetical protein